MDRKKQIRQQYKSQRPEMGIFLIASEKEKTAYLEACSDLKGQVNSTRFKLNQGLHKSFALQSLWEKMSPQQQEIRILERLPFEEGDQNRDYSDEQEILKMEWRKKLHSQYEKWIN